MAHIMDTPGTAGRTGWSCPSCSRAYAPWVYSCPHCPAKTAEAPAVPGFTPGDKVWPRAGGPMILQQAPKTVMATWRDPVAGDWLWLDGGAGHFGSWAAVHWTTEEPDAAAQAARMRRMQERIEENRRMAAENPARTFTERAFGPFSPILPVPVETPPSLEPSASACQPSREGGMCGCGEPGDDPGGDRASSPDDEWHIDLLERAWGIIANAGWDESARSPGWQEAAVRWRDRYHGWLKTHLSPGGYQSWEQLAGSLCRERDSLAAKVAELRRAVTDAANAKPIVPDDLARLSFTLPPYMAGENAVQVACIGPAWREVFPGLQACLRDVRTGAATVEFRLTPEGGQQRD